MAGKPLVSFLMPAYNAAATLERAVKSILSSRDAPELQVVVVDDGSTDETPEILARMAHRDSRLDPLTIGHQGLVDALIAGQARCRGSRGQREVGGRRLAGAKYACHRGRAGFDGGEAGWRGKTPDQPSYSRRSLGRFSLSAH